MKTFTRKRQGFTLIELLVVIAIIVILMAALFPVVNSVRRKAKVTQARQAINQIETAFRAYRDEYSRWPQIVLYGVPDPSTYEDTLTGAQMLESVMRMLGGENVDGQNAKRIPFLDPPPAARTDTGSITDYKDPWGQPYKFMLDYNDDGDLKVQFTSQSWTTNLNREIAAWSMGPNGDDSLNNNAYEDDITSW